jgi:glycogen debranching enzyme
VVGTSSITQPPLLALAARKLYEKEKDTSLITEIYPALKDHFTYLDRERSSKGFGPLVAIINPDESGEDNSPRFDEILNLAPIHIPDVHLDARLTLIKHFADCKFQTAACMYKYFSVIDVPFNILYAEDLEHLAYLAQLLGKPKDTALFRLRAAAVRKAIKEHLFVEKEFQSFDTTNQRHIKVSTWAKFMPLYGGLLSKKEARELIFTELLNPESFGTDFPIPSTSVSEPAFDPTNGFWRGPTWMAPNWFLYHGLKRYDFVSHAETIKEKSVALLELSGFREQYNPLTGEGQGGQNFTWGGLVLDME